MLSATIKFVTRISSPSIPVREGLLLINNTANKNYFSVLTLAQHNQKEVYLNSIKIYNTGLIKDPINDFETLKLFNELEKAIINKNKNEALECVEKFILNENGVYNADYGKAKQQLGDILHSYRQIFKITPLDILDNIGYSKNELLSMGVLETTLNKTKTCVSSTVFEILVMDTLHQKYSKIKKVYYCQDGAVKIKCINLTGQSNYDFVIEFKDEHNQLVRLAYDSKVQKPDTCLANLSARGLKYQILTVGNIPDSEIMQDNSFKNAVSKFNATKTQLVEKFASKKQSNLEVEPEPEDIMSSPFVATMFVNTDDISKTFAKKAVTNEDCNNDVVD